MDANTGNLNEIISSLTPDDINMLKDVAASVLGNQSGTHGITGGQSEVAGTGTANGANIANAVSAASSLSDSLGELKLDGIDFNMLIKAKSVIDRMNSTPNKNVDLINALKPHLKPETQSKADQALKIIKLFEILPLLRELF